MGAWSAALSWLYVVFFVMLRVVARVCCEGGCRCGVVARVCCEGGEGGMLRKGCYVLKLSNQCNSGAWKEGLLEDRPSKIAPQNRDRP